MPERQYVGKYLVREDLQRALEKHYNKPKDFDFKIEVGPLREAFLRALFDRRPAESQRYDFVGETRCQGFTRCKLNFASWF
jgi:hypothetical protein